MRSAIRKRQEGNQPRRKKVCERQTQLPDGVPPYIHISRNEFLDPKSNRLKKDDNATCECRYDARDPESACGNECLNVKTSIECTACSCPCGDRCRNQKFQRKEYAQTKLVNTGERGWGLLADEDIQAGTFIIEYCGEVISTNEANQRIHDYEAQGIKGAYVIALAANYIIDATRKGNLSRFINHSCQPNCETKKWSVLGETRVGIFAIKNICAGTELLYNYNFEWYGGANIRCLCGAPNCCKYLGAKSPAFVARNHVWIEGDPRYIVDDIPLYDSADDERSLPLESTSSHGPEEKEHLALSQHNPLSVDVRTTVVNHEEDDGENGDVGAAEKKMKARNTIPPCSPQRKTR